VTNKGVGGLLKKWGEGASLIRKEWKVREENGEGGKEEGSGLVDMKGHRADEDNGMAVDDDEDDQEEEGEPDDLEPTPRMLPRHNSLLYLSIINKWDSRRRPPPYGVESTWTTATSSATSCCTTTAARTVCGTCFGNGDGIS
jgi:hypothetical protein